MKGAWYFVYTYLDTFGGGLGGSVEHEETPLKATSEETAVAEATEIWKKKVAEATALWEKQKKEWKHPPASPFQDGPHTPRVIYKIPLESQR